MANELVVLENQLAPLAPQFAQVLGHLMQPERLIRTVVVSVERLPMLLSCDRQSLFNAAMSAACLGLEVDGVTGQAFLIPFAKKAQLVIGYKGYNTLAGRSGFAIRGATVREGDAFEYDLATAECLHKPKLGNKGRIVGAWARAVSNSIPALLSVLDIDALMETKSRSPGAKRSDSPWNDPGIGFPAMCEKTAKRRLARAMPLNVMQLGARMDEAFEEQGKHAWIAPDRGVMIEGEASPMPERQSQTPTAQQLISPSTLSAKAAPSEVQVPPADGAANLPDIDWPEYCDRVQVMLDGAESSAQIGEAWSSDFHKRLRRKIDPTTDQLAGLMSKVTARVNELKAITAAE